MSDQDKKKALEIKEALYRYIIDVTKERPTAPHEIASLAEVVRVFFDILGYVL